MDLPPLLHGEQQVATAVRLDECKAACYRVRRLLLARNVNADDVIGSVMAYQILVNCLMFSTLYLLAISFYTAPFCRRRPLN